MRRLFLTLVLLSFSRFATAQIPNGDFESWTTDSLGHPQPVGWTTTNLTYLSENVFQDAGRTGGSSVKIASAVDPDFGSNRGGIVNLPEQNCSTSIRPTTISGYWKIYNPGLNTVLAVDVVFYNANHSQVGLGSAGTLFNSNISSWTAFSEPINYTSQDQIVTYKVIITLGVLGPTTTSYGHIDDLSFDIPVLINENNLNPELYFITNVEQGRFLLSGLKIDKRYTLNLYGLNGNILNSETVASCEVFHVDLTTNASGIYFLCLESVDVRKIFRIIREY
jgi:hypothetical protein